MENGATPKKRGRPRGSLGKKKRHWKATIPEPKPLYDGPPRKRGRPSKVKPTDLPSSSEKAEQPQEEQPQEEQPQEEQPQEEQPLEEQPLEEQPQEKQQPQEEQQPPQEQPHTGSISSQWEHTTSLSGGGA
ncbi:drebrin-like protein [Clupea harengus]|uniref:Drebrin-like protein n=1 Tax=Clupea harengus TaxID=7950 RepID=A0A6P8FPW7_CLUHA|nr:drebrin-like protein [Clupea harengus]